MGNRAYLVAALFALTGCVAHDEPISAIRTKGSFFREKRDSFQILQESSALPEGKRLKVGESLTREAARRLWGELAKEPVGMRSFGPSVTLGFLLREIFVGDQDVPYAELLRRMERFRHLVVMRPDGCLSGAVTGAPLQWMGKVRVEGERFMAGGFEVGAFYSASFGVFFEVDAGLKRVPGALVGEVGLERDPVNARCRANLPRPTGVAPKPLTPRRVKGEAVNNSEVLIPMHRAHTQDSGPMTKV